MALGRVLDWVELLSHRIRLGTVMAKKMETVDQSLSSLGQLYCILESIIYQCT